MSEINDFLDGKQSSEIDGFLGPDTPKPSGAIRRIADQGIKLAQGVVGVPEAAVGVADLVTGGRAGKLAESSGVRFKDAKQIMGEYLSPEQKAADQEVAQAEGFLPTVGAMVRNPSTIAGSVMESAPSMIGGGAAARGLLKVAPKLGAIAAGAAGEGLVSAGQNAEQVRQESATGLLTPEQSAVLAASGAMTGGISLASGKLANKLGIGDVQTMLASGKLGPVGAEATAEAAKKGVIRKLGEGVLNEGVLQELPQSYQEQVAQNIAQGKPWDEGAAKAGAQGMLAGAAMGGGANVVSHFAEKAPVPTTETPPATSPLQLGNTPDPYLSFPDGTVARRSEIDAYINGLPADQQPAARAKMMGLTPQPGTPEPDPAAGPTPQLGYSPLAGTPTVFPDGSVALNGEQEFARRYAPQKPSEAMGLDPAAGPLSAAAVTAVDTGAHQEALDQQEFSDFVQSEQRNLQVMRAQKDQERTKQTQLDSVQAQSKEELGRLPDQQVSAAMAATDETPTALQIAMQQARERTGKKIARQAPAAPETPTVAPEPRVVLRTNDMQPMPRELAELQVDMDGGEVVRIQNRNGKYAYTVIKDSNGPTDAAKPVSGASLPTGRTDVQTSVGPGVAPDAGTGEQPGGNAAAVLGQPAELSKPVDASPLTAREATAAANRAKLQATREKRAQGRKSPEGLSYGIGPNTSTYEPVTVKDGIVWVGKYPSQNFDTGEYVAIHDGATHEEIKAALRQDGFVGKNGRFHSAGEAANEQNAAPRADTTPAAQAVEAPAVVESNAAASEGLPGAGPASVEGDGIDADQADAPSIEDINSGKAFVDNTKSKIAEWVSKATNNGAREIDRNWERAAVKRFVDANIKAMLDGKQTGNRAAAKIAIGKSQTFSELSTAIEKFTNNTPTVTPGALSGVTSQASQPQEQPNGPQAAQAITPTPQREAQAPDASQRLTPAQAGKLQEAHKAHGLDVTLQTVQRMHDRVMKSLITGKGSNGGVEYNIKPKERKELQAQADRLANDLSLFGVQQEAASPASAPVAPKSLREVVERKRAEKAKPVEQPAEQPKEAVAPEEASDSRPGEPTAEQIESVGDVVRITKSAGKEIKRTVNARDAMKTLNERAEALQILAKACK